ncbi:MULTISPECIES: hypothetical protein [Sorangium]|uniref:CBM11 domain-containing protein n=1 Tax=Sorangium cellulosum TaxID=56 RepID=A0A4V0NF46_SORCE|nr:MULTISPECIES: hypothetical protein [Sorangium]AUX28402.1 hypothetical protein SOCE836_004720 [Sorangium cellulosum]WCQ87794.1 hypothetical protein NQZ70_00457 [Sorangium sp. Soce836]
MAKRRAAWMWAAWTLTAGGCTALVGLDERYHLVEGAGGAAGATGGGSSASATDGAGAGGGDVAVPTDLDLIDDMEDGDGTITETGGRLGHWYSYNDGTGTQSPPVYTEEVPVGFVPEALMPPRGESTMAMHTFGSGFTEWGAGVGFALNGEDMQVFPYDASAYAGIAFWAKLGDPDAEATMKVSVSDRVSEPAGGICDEAAGSGEPNRCFDHWFYTAHLGTEWAQVVIPFEELTREGWGAEPDAQAVDVAGLYVIEFRFAQDEDFDVYVDDVSFYR